MYMKNYYIKAIHNASNSCFSWILISEWQNRSWLLVTIECNKFLFWKVVLPILWAIAVWRSLALQDHGRQKLMIESAAVTAGVKICICFSAKVTLGSFESKPLLSWCCNGWALRKTEQYCPLILPDGELVAIHWSKRPGSWWTLVPRPVSKKFVDSSIDNRPEEWYTVNFSKQLKNLMDHTPQRGS